MFNLAQMLKEDETYKKILAASPPEERAALERYMEEFMKCWQESLSTLENKITNDEEFRINLRKKLVEKEEVDK